MCCVQAKPTDAKFTLSDPSEVMTFLEQLVHWGSTADNAWHQAQSCTGWALKPERASSQSNSPKAPPPAATSADAAASRPRQRPDDAPANGRLAADGASASISDRHNDTAGEEDSGSRGSHSTAPSQLSKSVRPKQGVPGPATDSMHSTQGRPPTNSGTDSLEFAEFRRPSLNAGMFDARRTSLDHYLTSSEASFTEPQQQHQDSVPTGNVSQHSLTNEHVKEDISDKTLDKNGERLTALLLDKLHGHASHPVEQEDANSLPAATSNDSGSMAGYRSPFESLASYGVPEEIDSVHAEHGSAASLANMLSSEFKD